ncbi:MAG: hypothetical protein ACK55I_44995, partial [bacterium]
QQGGGHDADDDAEDLESAEGHRFDEAELLLGIDDRKGKTRADYQHTEKEQEEQDLHADELRDGGERQRPHAGDFQSNAGRLDRGRGHDFSSVASRKSRSSVVRGLPLLRSFA